MSITLPIVESATILYVIRGIARRQAREPKMSLDKTDLRILGELQADARISVAELSKRVALTPTPCARRLQQLEESGVIKAYVAVLDQAALGLPVDAFVEVRLTREGKAEVA